MHAKSVNPILEVKCVLRTLYNGKFSLRLRAVVVTKLVSSLGNAPAATLLCVTCPNYPSTLPSQILHKSLWP